MISVSSPTQGLMSPGSAEQPASTGALDASAPSEFDLSWREWRCNGRPPEARRERAREVRVDRSFAAHTGWLHEHELGCPERRREPGADAVARDVPRVGKRVRISEPAIRGDNRNA